MNKVSDVIKEFIKISKLAHRDNNDFIFRYSSTIAKYLVLETKYKEIVELSKKPIYHYFKYSLPVYDKDYFDWLYNVWNPIRFSVETFDNIEEIRIELIEEFKDNVS